MLLPHQRPTYRSIEVRTEHGIEDRQSRYLGDPAERLAQIVVGAILAQPVNVPDKKPETADHSKDFEGSDGGQLPEPVDNGDGVIVS